jgi:hypothetical protein
MRLAFRQTCRRAPVAHQHPESVRQAVTALLRLKEGERPRRTIGQFGREVRVNGDVHQKVHLGLAGFLATVGQATVTDVLPAKLHGVRARGSSVEHEQHGTTGERARPVNFEIARAISCSTHV